MECDQQIRNELLALYGERKGSMATDQLLSMLECYRVNRRERRALTERDVVLISYGDALRAENERPLAVLKVFADRYLRKCFSAIHILPFYPFSSDDGFSVTDFLAVNPPLGDWEDIEHLGEHFDLMLDFVLNHISAGSDWFRRYLYAEPGFDDLAIEVAPETDLSLVVRPRTLPLLTPFKKMSGEAVWLWTTFSADQVDLNYASLDVLFRMVEVMLEYVKRGAGLLRLDAVAYLWKEIGTTCIHLPQTHALIRLLRCILDQIAPEVLIVTETNVPHEENISYFGDGLNEAQMVYNFTLPPLLMHAMLTADTSALSNWAHALRPPSKQSVFFNFTASHDGIGMRPLEGIIPDDDIARLMQSAIERGGQVSFGQSKVGRAIPYELNITYVDAVRGTNGEDEKMNVRRFLASQAVALALPGVPGVYLYSLLGSRNWQEGVQVSGRARTINRQPLQMPSIIQAFENEHHFRTMIFRGCCRLLEVRRMQPAFHPHAGSAVLDLDRRIFAIRRDCSQQTIYALNNLSPHITELNLTGFASPSALRDVLSRQLFEIHSVVLQPYQTAWLTAPETAF